MFEVFEHTADVGVRAEAETPESLYEQCARGLLEVFLENPDSVRPVKRRSVRIGGADHVYLLFDMINELLYLFERERMVFGEYRAALSEGELRMELAGEGIDRERHQLAHEVKAVTYHELAFEPANGGWRARFILDI